MLKTLELYKVISVFCHFTDKQVFLCSLMSKATKFVASLAAVASERIMLECKHGFAFALAAFMWCIWAANGLWIGWTPNQKHAFIILFLFILQSWQELHPRDHSLMLVNMIPRWMSCKIFPLFFVYCSSK